MLVEKTGPLQYYWLHPLQLAKQQTVKLSYEYVQSQLG